MVINLHDRRVQKTRRLFQEALIKLLQEKSYSIISIEDLADEANVGRTTFYLHYQDKDALLEECIINVLSKLTEKIQSFTATHWGSNGPREIQMLFEFVCENEKFFKIMLHDPCGFIFFQRFQKIVVDWFHQELRDENASLHLPLSIPLEFLSTFYAGAILATIEWWVENEKPYGDAYMVEMVSQTIGKAHVN